MIKSIKPTQISEAVKNDMVREILRQKFEILLSHIGSIIAEVNFNNKENTAKYNIGDILI